MCKYLNFSICVPGNQFTWSHFWGFPFHLFFTLLDRVGQLGYYHSPAQDAPQEWGIEALWGRQSSLNFSHRHLVLGCGAEQGEASWHWAEDLGWVGHHAQKRLLLIGQGQGATLGKRHRTCSWRKKKSPAWCQLKAVKNRRNRMRVKPREAILTKSVCIIPLGIKSSYT